MDRFKEFKGEVDIEFKSLSTTDEFVEIEGYASVITKDRDGDVVVPQGIDIENFMKNPILLYQHKRDVPIGKVENAEITEKGLYIRAKVFKDMSKEAYVGIKNGILKTFSVGFRALDGKYDEFSDTFYITKSELFEVSVVSIPANPDAIFEFLEMPCGSGFCLGKKHFKGIDTKSYKVDNTKISAKSCGDVDKTKLRNDLKENGGKLDIDECYLYVEDYDKVSTWCCPHHELDGGTLVVNKGGVISAYQALKGAHGNKPDMPKEDYDKAMRHIAKHYKEMKKQGLIEEIPEDLKEFVEVENKSFEYFIKELIEKCKIYKEDFENNIDFYLNIYNVISTYKEVVDEYVKQQKTKNKEIPVEELKKYFDEKFEALEKLLEPKQEDVEVTKESVIEYVKGLEVDEALSLYSEFEKEINEKIATALK